MTTIGRVLIGVDASGWSDVCRGAISGGEEARGIDATVGAMMRRSRGGGIVVVSRGGTGAAREGGTGALGIDATVGVTKRRPCRGATGTGARSLTKSITSRYGL